MSNSSRESAKAKYRASARTKRDWVRYLAEVRVLEREKGLGR